jgi:hypothetical protein
MRSLLCLLLIVIIALAASCGGKKEAKKVSPDSELALEAFSVVETIRDAYVRKDHKSIERSTTREGYRSVMSAVKPFDHAELDCNPAWVEIEGSEVRVNVSWKGKWHKAGKMTDERGMAVFVMRGKPLKLDAILRANPFAYPE